MRNAKLKRVPFSRIARVVGGVALAFYLSRKVYRFYDEYAVKVEGLRRLKKSFETRDGVQNGLSIFDFYLAKHQVPMAFLVPEDSDALSRLLATCDKFGIAVGFSDRPEFLNSHVLHSPMEKPFVLVDLKKLNSIVVSPDADAHLERHLRSRSRGEPRRPAGHLQRCGPRSAVRAGGRPQQVALETHQRELAGPRSHEQQHRDDRVAALRRPDPLLDQPGHLRPRPLRHQRRPHVRKRERLSHPQNPRQVPAARTVRGQPG